MTLIVDANRACDFTRPLAGHAELILRQVNARQIRLTVGGELYRELSKTKFINILSELGRIRMIDRQEDSDIDDETALVSGLSIRSDDPHVIALVRRSGCRLVYTHDDALIEDLGDTSLVRPRAKVAKATTPARSVRTLLRENAG